MLQPRALVSAGCGGGSKQTKTTKSLLDAVQDAVSSSEFSEGYRAMFAFDGKPETRWMASSTTWTGWIEARFAEPLSFSRASFVCAVQENEGVPKDFVVEYFDAVTNDWAVATGVKDHAQAQWAGEFETKTADRWRLRVMKVINDRGDLSISELDFSR